MIYKYDNGGYKTGKGMIKNCTIRALSIMFDTHYLFMQKELQNVSKSVFKKELDFSNGCPTQVTEYFMRFIKWRFLSVRDKQDIPLLRLRAEDLPSTNCFPVMQQHISVIKDGVNRDANNPYNRPIYGVYVDDRVLPKIFDVWPALNRVWQDIHVADVSESKRDYLKNGFILPSK